MDDALSYEAISLRVAAVKRDRLETVDKAVNKLASKPHQFREFKGDDAKKIFVPIVSSRVGITFRQDWLEVMSSPQTKLSMLQRKNCGRWLFSSPGFT
jgi:hypothetical protein